MVGHADVLMGVLCTSNDELAKKLNFLQLGELNDVKHVQQVAIDCILCAVAVGCVPSPFDCYLANRGLKTLHLRMREHEKNATAIAKYLEKSPFVVQVFYPGNC